MTDIEARKAACDVVARHMLARALEQAATFENVGWEDYPEITEADFEAAFERAEKIVESLQASEEAYDAAYAHLVSLVDGDADV